MALAPQPDEEAREAGASHHVTIQAQLCSKGAVLTHLCRSSLQFIVKRLTILMDSLSHSLAQREQEVATRDGAIYIQKMWRGYSEQ